MRCDDVQCFSVSYACNKSIHIYMRCDDVQCFSVSYACNKSIHI